MFWLKAVKVGYRLFKEVGEDDLSGASSELAYKFFLALFPFFIFLAALGGFVSQHLDVANPTDEVMNLLGNSLPADSTSVLRSQVDQVVKTQSTALLSFGILGAVWSAASGVGSMIKAMNRVYEVKETRSLPKRYGLAVGLTLLGGGALIAAFVLLLAGQLYGSEIADRLNYGDQTQLMFSIARWPIAVLLLLIAIAFLFWAAPNIDLPWRWITPGALLFVGIWLPATYLFGLYVANFGSYDDTYGALGGVVALLFWLYLTSFILLAAAELNSILAQEGAPQELEARAGEAATSHTARGGQAAENGRDEVIRVRTPESRYNWLAAAFIALVGIWTTAIKPRFNR